jgi:hypothetical protein
MIVETWLAPARRWLRAERTPLRRALIAGPPAAGLLALAVIIIEATDARGEWVLPIGVVLAISYGWFVRSWVAVPGFYAWIVALAWIAEIATFLYLGGAEWEARNIEHWQGTEMSAVEKLMGQLFEFAIFPILTVPFTWLGVVIERILHPVHGFKGQEHEPLGA